MKRGRRYVDALSVAALAGAPQLLLIVEVPTLPLGLNDTGVFQAFVWIRGVLVILTLRVFYWGLRRVLDAGRLAAWCFVLLPLGLGVAWGVAAIVLGG